MAEVQGALGVPLDAEVDRLDALGARAAVVRVARELEPRAPEAFLGLEDARIADSHLEGLVGGVVEVRVGNVGELEDLAPLGVLALDVVGVEDGGRVAVKVGGDAGSLDAPVKDDGALDGGRGGGVDMGAGRDGHGGREQAEEGRGMHRGVFLGSVFHCIQDDL